MRMGRVALAFSGIGTHSLGNSITVVGGEALSDTGRYGAAQRVKGRCAGPLVRGRPATSSAHRRLARLYDRADLLAIASTDARLLATLTLAHWLYVRATAVRPYAWRKMASDYRFNLLDRTGCRRADIRAMDRRSRPQIARRILIAHYVTSRADRQPPAT